MLNLMCMELYTLHPFLLFRLSAPVLYFCALHSGIIFSTEILSLMCCSNFHANPPTQPSPHIRQLIPSLSDPGEKGSFVVYLEG